MISFSGNTGITKSSMLVFQNGMMNINSVNVIGHISVPYMTSNIDTDNEAPPLYQLSIAQNSISGLTKTLPKL
jgi:hypothetical protein